MIEVKNLSTHYGERIAVRDLSFVVLAPWAGFGVFCGYAAVLLIALVRRDV